jgi:hypothetical protein
MRKKEALASLLRIFEEMRVFKSQYVDNEYDDSEEMWLDIPEFLEREVPEMEKALETLGAIVPAKRGECQTCGGDEYLQPCEDCGGGTRIKTEVGERLQSLWECCDDPRIQEALLETAAKSGVELQGEAGSGTKNNQ